MHKEFKASKLMRNWLAVYGHVLVLLGIALISSFLESARAASLTSWSFNGINSGGSNPSPGLLAPATSDPN
ncbi:MAG TPA: hypothetical protein VGI75_13155, partial [Pirellulales bacterium]